MNDELKLNEADAKQLEMWMAYYDGRKTDKDRRECARQHALSALLADRRMERWLKYGATVVAQDAAVAIMARWAEKRWEVFEPGARPTIEEGEIQKDIARHAKAAWEIAKILVDNAPAGTELLVAFPPLGGGIK